MEFLLESWNGGEFDVFPTRINPDPQYPYYTHIEMPSTPTGYLDSKLHLNEDSFSLVIAFMDKYLDRGLLPQYRDLDIKDESFGWYEDNIYRYSDLRCMLEEIRATAQDIVLGKTTESIRQMILHQNPSWYGIHGEVDKAQLFDAHRSEIADYLLRFCDAVQAVMDNAPEFDLLDFQGP